jgi:hypothetical protein
MKAFKFRTLPPIAQKGSSIPGEGGLAGKIRGHYKRNNNRPMNLGKPDEYSQFSSRSPSCRDPEFRGTQKA